MTENGGFIFDATWVLIWKTTLFTLPVELDSENSIATQPSDAKTLYSWRSKKVSPTTYPDEESSGLESEATDNDELPKDDQGIQEFCQITLKYVTIMALAIHKLDSIKIADTLYKFFLQIRTCSSWSVSKQKESVSCMYRLLRRTMDSAAPQGAGWKSSR